jgi:hypothetical protein
MNPHKAESSICNLVELGNLKKLERKFASEFLEAKEDVRKAQEVVDEKLERWKKTRCFLNFYADFYGLSLTHEQEKENNE